jgi:peptide/nickel transport system substrate-binding protein
MKRSRMSWRLSALAASVLLVVVAAGAGAARSALGGADRAAAGTIVDGSTDTITNVDPAGAYNFGTFTLEANTFERLLDFRNSAKLEPSLATKCFFVGNLKTWKCNLRKGVTFHDGSAFDSTDVKWSFDRVTNAKIVKQAGQDSPSPLLGNLKSVKTNGKYAVTFNLKSPQSTWPLILGTQAGFIVPSDTYPKDKLLSNTETQVGTGPFKLTKFTPGQQAVFVRNDDYWGPKAKSDGLIINYYAKSSTMKLALQKGDIDMAFQTFTPTEVASLAETKGIGVNQGPVIAIRYFVFNVKREPTNNLAVRKAVAYLMPRQTIASRVYHGTVTPLYSQPPAGLPGHIDAFASLYGRSPNPAKAKAVMQHAGLQMPFPLEVWWTPTHYGDASADEYAEIKRGLERNGVFKVTLKSTEWAQYVSTLGTQYDAYQLGWYPDYPDVENYIVPFYRNDTFTASGYDNPKMEALIKQEFSATTTAKRLTVAKKIQLLAAKDLPIIPVWQGNMIAPSRSNIHGISRTLDAAYIMRFWKLSKS